MNTSLQCTYNAVVVSVYLALNAREDHAYKGVSLLCTVILFQPEGAPTPLLIDVFKVTGNELHQYDLPFWYQGRPFEQHFLIVSTMWILHREVTFLLYLSAC